MMCSYAANDQPVRAVAVAGGEEKEGVGKTYKFSQKVYGLYTGYSYVCKVRSIVKELRVQGEWSAEIRFKCP